MRNIESWQPSKFVPSSRGWIPSRDPKELGVGSQIVAAIQIAAYEPLIRTHARGRLLDLGCGKVPYFGIYRDHISEVTCVDWVESVNPSPHLDLSADLNRPVPLPDASFDTILATDLLEHIVAPELLWSEMVRLLAPGGSLIVAMPFMYWLHEEPHDYHRFTVHKFTQLCRQSGLSIVHLEPYGGAPDIIVDIIAKHASRWPWFARFWNWFGLLFLQSRYGRKLSGWQRDGFPSGYCLVARKP